MVFWGNVEKNESRDSEHYHARSNPCPWLVFSSDHIHRRLPLVQAIPLTSQLDKDQAAGYRNFRIRLLEAQHFEKYELQPGDAPLTGDSLALTEQLRVFAHDRLMGNPVAKVTVAGLAAVEGGVRFVLEMP